MKEKILNLIFTNSEKTEEMTESEDENSIYREDEKQFAGYLEKKATPLDMLFHRDSLTVSKYIRVEQIEADERVKSLNKVETARLAASIREHGMMLPITIYKTDKKRYKVIDGAKRLEAIKMLGRKEVFCTLLPCSEQVAKVLRICGECGDILEYGRKVGDILGSGALDRELISSVSLLSDQKIGSLIDISLLKASEIVALKKISLENLLCEIAAIRDVRFRDYVIVTLTDYFKAFEEDMQKVIANKDKHYTPSDRMIFKDIRIVFNSIEGSLNKLRRSGVRVTAEKCESDEEYTYVIKVKKP